MVLCISGCDLTAINENPNAPTDEENFNFDDARLAGAFRTGVPVMEGDDEQRIKSLIIDFYAQILDGGGYDTKYYMSNEDWNQRMFRRIQSAVSSLNIVIRNLAGEESRYGQTIAVAKIWRVYVQSNGVDYFGPIPFAKYTEIESNPPYKSVEDTYLEFFRELDEAISLFDAGSSNNVFESSISDALYKNDAARWRRFASSLRLRLAMRLSEIAENTCRSEVSKALSAGVMESARDNARISPWADGGWGSDYNYTMFQITWGGPLTLTSTFEKLVEGLGGIAWEGSLVNRRAVYGNTDLSSRIDANFRHPAIIDPRATRMFEPPFQKPSSDDFGNEWKGLTVGLSSADRGKDENNRNYYPELGILFDEEDAPYKSRPYDVMLFEEVCFLKSEAFLRGFASGDARAAYEDGIRASFTTWGVPHHVESYLSSTSKNLAGTSVKFDDDITSPGNTQLEKIITQKYLSLFPDMSMEAWNDKRRLNLPRMDVSAYRTELLYNNSDLDIKKPTNFIKRVQYPQNETQINKTEYDKGVALLKGDDVVSTPLWWDVNANYCTSSE
jgi:hypothetical protein